MFNFGDNNMILIILLAFMIFGGGFGYGDDNTMIIMIVVAMFMLGNNGFSMCENK